MKFTVMSQISLQHNNVETLLFTVAGISVCLKSFGCPSISIKMSWNLKWNRCFGNATGTPRWWQWGEESKAWRRRRSETFLEMRCTCQPQWRTLSRPWRRFLNLCLQLTWRSMRSGLKSLDPAEKRRARVCVWEMMSVAVVCVYQVEALCLTELCWQRGGN